MIYACLALLTLFDMVILGLLYSLLRRRSDGAEILTEITNERRLFAELYHEAQDELTSARAAGRQTHAEIKHLAAEIEQEIKNSKDTIGAHMTDIISQLSSHVDAPLVELTKKQNALELLSRKLASEKSRLLSLLAKAEKICNFFDERLPYEEVVKDIAVKKYGDARKLLAQGLPRAEVAKELGLSLTEIDLMQGMTTYPD